MKTGFECPAEFVLGTRFADSIPQADQVRQRREVEEILRRLNTQPGLILADEVGMGKTFVALGAAYSVASQSPRGPVIVMVPPNLVDKWEQDLKTFCSLYLVDRQPLACSKSPRSELRKKSTLRFGVARHSVELLRYLDDDASERCHLIFLAQGSMGRGLSDKWVRLAMIAEALRRHGRGKARRLIQVKETVHRHLSQLIWARGEEKAHELGERLWQKMLKASPEVWKEMYNSSLREGREPLPDDPVPKSVLRALRDLDLRVLATGLERMPVRRSSDDSRTDERVAAVRKVMQQVSEQLWANVLSRAKWWSPLLVLDEAHHLKNPNTQLARRFQSSESSRDLRTGDGALAQVFDRMLFLTATPFQLGHHELMQVLRRFGDVRWDASELGDRALFLQALETLGTALDDSQRAAIGLQRVWGRLSLADVGPEPDQWWDSTLAAPKSELGLNTRAVVEAFALAKEARSRAQKALKPWILRHNKEDRWIGTEIARRRRLEGSAIHDEARSGGLPVPPRQLLPFFLAARSAVRATQDLLGEALSSSFEAFRNTRSSRAAERDDLDEEVATGGAVAQANWYLEEFDRALGDSTGIIHPKIAATVNRVADLWEAGEKVLIFAFYRQTCRALRIHISQEIEARLMTTAARRMAAEGMHKSPDQIQKVLEKVQERYFDKLKQPGRRAVDAELRAILQQKVELLDRYGVSAMQRQQLEDVMRRFLRVTTTLARYFPLATFDSMEPRRAVQATLNTADASGTTWRQKFSEYVEFICKRRSDDERALYLEAALRTQTGGIRVEDAEQLAEEGELSRITLANVQVATGETRRDVRSRLMRAFNTPFFPDVFVCSEVMGEGVDLQRLCRHVIHHDLSWNPSSIEQRTGRIDRLGCKAEGRHPIYVYLPYVAGAADERQFRVMSDREKWFRVVMGQDEVARLISEDQETRISLPDRIARELSFELGVRQD